MSVLTDKRYREIATAPTVHFEQQDGTWIADFDDRRYVIEEVGHLGVEYFGVLYVIDRAVTGLHVGYLTGSMIQLVTLHSGAGMVADAMSVAGLHMLAFPVKVA